MCLEVLFRLAEAVAIKYLLNSFYLSKLVNKTRTLVAHSMSFHSEQMACLFYYDLASACDKRKLIKYAETSGFNGLGARAFRSLEKLSQFELFTRPDEIVMEGVNILVVCHQPEGRK